MNWWRTLWGRKAEAWTPERCVALTRARLDAMGGYDVRADASSPLKLELTRRADGESLTIHLDNLFAELGPAPERVRVKGIERFLRTMADAPATPAGWTDAADKLMPVVRGASLVHEMPALALSRPFAPALREFVVIDEPNGMAFVTNEQVATWGVSVNEVFDRAHANLLRVPPKLVLHDKRASPSLLRVSNRDGYESSRLLVLPQLLHALDGKLAGRPIAFVPHRDAMLIGTASSPAELARMLDAAEALLDNPRFISHLPYTLDDDGCVVPLEVPTDHPLYARLRRAQNELKGTEYKRQREVLDRTHEREGPDVFLATFGSLELEGVSHSWTVWAKDVLSWLPEADLIGFHGFPEEERAVFVPWTRAMEIAGDCLEPVDHAMPPRHSTRAWPSPTQCEALLRARISLGGEPSVR